MNGSSRNVALTGKAEKPGYDDVPALLLAEIRP